MNENVAFMLYLIGIFLIVLAAIAGVILLAKATIAKSNEVHGRGTLWGIFIIGLIAGIWLIIAVGSRR